MNKNAVSNDAPRYEKLSKPKAKVDTTSNLDAFKVKRGALSYHITDKLNQLAQPKRKSNSNSLEQSPLSSSKDASLLTEKQGQSRLVNSSEQSRRAQECGKTKFLKDTYACITANSNKRYPKRLRDFAKTKQDFSKVQGDASMTFNANYCTSNFYSPRSPIFEKRKM